jgi:hypothetical protein
MGRGQRKGCGEGRGRDGEEEVMGVRGQRKGGGEEIEGKGKMNVKMAEEGRKEKERGQRNGKWNRGD